MTAQHFWDEIVAQDAPQSWDAPELDEDGVRALFYRGAPYRGRETRVFAFIGLPAAAKRAPVPAMVLVHGGGGTAFSDWVRLWNARGYAALALDTCGATAGGTHSDRPPHQWAGPLGWRGWDEIEQNPRDQWVFHAVAATIAGHSLLRSLDEVDETRVGVTGISWGGIFASILAGADARFALAAPVYGCGFLKELSLFQNLKPAECPISERWMEQWEPAPLLARAQMPLLWVNGTNDFAFPLDAHQHSYRVPPAPRNLSIGLRMAHSQEAGSRAPEIFAFADQYLRGGQPLLQTGETVVQDGVATASVQAPARLVRAEFLWTRDAGNWSERLWQSQIARVEAGRVCALLPTDATACFFNFTDERGLLTSSELHQISPTL